MTAVTALLLAATATTSPAAPTAPAQPMSYWHHAGWVLLVVIALAATAAPATPMGTAVLGRWQLWLRGKLRDWRERKDPPGRHARTDQRRQTRRSGRNLRDHGHLD